MQRTGRLATPRAQRIRRSRAARVLLLSAVVFLGTALFRLQVVGGEENLERAAGYRLRELPIPAPRGTIYDRTGRVVAENVPGYLIQIMPSVPTDSMDAQIARLQPIIGLTDEQLARARRRWQRQRHLPMVLLSDAPPDRGRRPRGAPAQFPSVLVQEYRQAPLPRGRGGRAFHRLHQRDQRAGRDGDAAVRGLRAGPLDREGGAGAAVRAASRRRAGQALSSKIDARGRIKRWLPEEMGPAAGARARTCTSTSTWTFRSTSREIFPKEFDGRHRRDRPAHGRRAGVLQQPVVRPERCSSAESADRCTASC
jgi:hypothetical protein